MISRYGSACKYPCVLGIIIIIVALLNACGNKSSSDATAISGLPNGNTIAVVTGSNVMQITANGSLCSQNSAYPNYPNEPCVSVKICAPGSTTNCQQISNILLDTGSYGLRVFKSVLNSALATALTASEITSGTSTVGECVLYGDGSSDWGPVVNADVVLGSEPAVTVPIQMIDASFSKPPSSCTSLDQDPSIGFNGILGVGLFVQDCGDSCANNKNNGMYYGCTGSGATASCTALAVSLVNQVTNPVAKLPTDNNGVILKFPSIALGGVSAVSGYLILGINTQSNNAPGSVTTYATNANGDFLTAFNGTVGMTAFLDSGSNAYFFPVGSMSSTLKDCGLTNSQLSGFFCPASAASLSATTSGTSGSPSSTVPFSIGNTYTLFSGNNMVFIEMGADAGFGGDFDWGFPFFLGRNVVLGFEGAKSSLGTGPYWAY